MGLGPLGERYETLRFSVASLLGVRHTEIALTSSVFAALNAIASDLRFDSPRNRIVITDLQFPTQGQIWRARGRSAPAARRPAARSLSLPGVFRSNLTIAKRKMR